MQEQANIGRLLAAKTPIDDILLGAIDADTAHAILFEAWTRARDRGFDRPTENQLLGLYEEENRRVLSWQKPLLADDERRAIDTYLLERKLVRTGHRYAHLPLIKNYRSQDLRSHERALIRVHDTQGIGYSAGISCEAPLQGLVYGTRRRADNSLAGIKEVPLEQITRYQPIVATSS